LTCGRGFRGLGIEVFGFVEQRRVAEDDGERVVELPGDVAGELAETNELLGFDELLEHHGLAANRLQARGENLDRKQIDGADGLGGVFGAGEEDRTLGRCTAAQGDGLHGGELEAGQVVARDEERGEIKVERQAVLNGSRTGAGIEKALYGDSGDERFEGIRRGVVETGGPRQVVMAVAL
jgi:hypothetical protein